MCVLLCTASLLYLSLGDKLCLQSVGSMLCFTLICCTNCNFIVIWILVGQLPTSYNMPSDNFGVFFFGKFVFCAHIHRIARAHTEIFNEQWKKNMMKYQSHCFQVSSSVSCCYCFTHLVALWRVGQPPHKQVYSISFVSENKQTRMVNFEHSRFWLCNYLYWCHSCCLGTGFCDLFEQYETQLVTYKNILYIYYILNIDI